MSLPNTSIAIILVLLTAIACFTLIQLEMRKLAHRNDGDLPLGIESFNPVFAGLVPEKIQVRPKERGFFSFTEMAVATPSEKRHSVRSPKSRKPFGYTANGRPYRRQA
jgi:hypothetical protein